MAIQLCKDYKSEISSEAKKCPHCGRPNKPFLSDGKLAVLLLVIAVIALWVFAQHSRKKTAEQDAAQQAEVNDTYKRLTGTSTISDQVATDAVAQYRIAETQGDPVQLCVQAGFVAAAYLQAQDAIKYTHWKKMEQFACKRAGVAK